MYQKQIGGLIIFFIMSEGRIIAVVGGPRSGKSFLTKKLAEYYGGTPFIEEELPIRIQENLKKGMRDIERHLWFRNQQVKIYLEAEELKRQGRIVILDNFWISYQLYLESTTGFEREVVDELAEIDRQMFGWPDLVILLHNSEEGIREFVKKGKREFDNSEEYIQRTILPINAIQEKFFKGQQSKRNVVVIDRDGLDFKESNHFEELLERIKSDKVLV